MNNAFKVIAVMVALIVLMAIFMMFSLNHYPKHKLIITNDQGNKLDSLEMDGYFSIYDLRSIYRVRFYQEKGMMPETYYNSVIWYEQVY